MTRRPVIAEDTAPSFNSADLVMEQLGDEYVPRRARRRLTEDERGDPENTAHEYERTDQ